jgi:hypothetical protein
MTNMVNSGDVYGRAGDWLIGTAKRHPEALLVCIRRGLCSPVAQWRRVLSGRLLSKQQ